MNHKTARSGLADSATVSIVDKCKAGGPVQRGRRGSRQAEIGYGRRKLGTTEICVVASDFVDLEEVIESQQHVAILVGTFGCCLLVFDL
jgi:hypothetical protein